LPFLIVGNKATKEFD